MSDDDGTDESYYQEIAELLRFKKNIIIEGAPGVGKTYELPRIITRLCFLNWVVFQRPFCRASSSN